MWKAIITTTIITIIVVITIAIICKLLNIKDKINSWLNERKQKDDGLTQFLKWVYSVGRISWLHTIITAILGIAIPEFINMKNIPLTITFGLIMVLDIIFVGVCNSYHKKLYIRRKFASEVLLEQSTLLNSMVVFIENNPTWKAKIFKTVSELVCEKIQLNFKEIYNCRTRVSVEYVFNKAIPSTKHIEKHVKMSGRRSEKRSTVKKAIPLSKRQKYYSYQIFISNNDGVNILSQDEIKQEDTWYKNPHNNVKVKKYIGVAVSTYDDPTIRFILQIDCLDDIKFGEHNTDEEIKEFIDDYLMSYINIVTLAYLLNLNNKKEIPEV